MIVILDFIGIITGIGTIGDTTTTGDGIIGTIIALIFTTGLLLL